jgi:hypothetical protein
MLVVVLAAVGATVAAKSYWRVAVETPQDVAVFEAHRLEQLAQLGQDANTPEAQIVEARLRDWSAKGFFGLANPFGSMLIVLGFAAAGLAIDKFRAWHGHPRKALGPQGGSQGRVRRRMGASRAPAERSASSSATAGPVCGRRRSFRGSRRDGPRPPSRSSARLG